ncbi:hypothetical protein BDA96_02G282500 [Sorghum bicolor]|uniref:Uncharacterized protein n=2 Tax=Sorghum bicolor TaxID=4558 RepID=A0A921RSW5_SORBI|nr:hypothetical protein BDA96_02G282500 [Sorghum bicolor]OQU89794.1 hypothetical protein SORBI_3002G268966 [Sorghum bicolor]
MWRRGACGHRRRGHRTGPGSGRPVGGGGSPLGLPSGIAPSSTISTSCTPCCFFCHPFPPTSTTKHIKNILLARQPGHRSPASASKMSRPTAGFSFRCLCVCNCSFSLLLVLAIENLFDLISCTDDG